MRVIALLPIAALLAGCWSPGPGQRQANRYPWDPKGAPAEPAPPAPAPMIEAHGAIPRSPLAAEPAPVSQWHRPPDGTYCVVALQPPVTGVVILGNPGAVQASDCTVPQPHQP